MVVYLIHFEKPYKGTQHYIGWTVNLERRISHHRKNTGCAFLAAINRAGIAWEVVRTWEGADGNFERELKKWKKAKRFCPVCSPATAQNSKPHGKCQGEIVVPKKKGRKKKVQTTEI